MESAVKRPAMLACMPSCAGQLRPPLLSLSAAPAGSSATSSPALPPSVFGVSLDLTPKAVASMEKPCSCCRPAVPTPTTPAACQVLGVYADPSEVGHAEGEHVGRALQRVFGAEGLRMLFGCASPAGARRIKSGGMNHVFMVAHAGRLVKCVRPEREYLSEAMEAERLQRQCPGLSTDEHALFPLATFLCQAAVPLCGQHYEVAVFEYLHRCRSVGDLVRMFESTHPTGARQSTAACLGHRNSGTCEHVLLLQSLVVHQVTRLSLRFQALYGRRHGDLKADNVLIDRCGMPRLGDFLSPFCTSCDREEFMNSIPSVHPVVQSLRSAFDSAWHVEAKHNAEVSTSYWVHCGRPLEPGDCNRNAQLLEALDHLDTARQSQPLFGPMPCLLSSMGMAPTMSFSLPSATEASLAEGMTQPQPTLAVQGTLSGAFPLQAASVGLGAPLTGMLLCPQLGLLDQLPGTGLPSPLRGLRCPALPTSMLASMDRETPCSMAQRLGPNASPSASPGQVPSAFGLPPPQPQGIPPASPSRVGNRLGLNAPRLSFAGVNWLQGCELGSLSPASNGASAMVAAAMMSTGPLGLPPWMMTPNTGSLTPSRPPEALLTPQHMRA